MGHDVHAEIPNQEHAKQAGHVQNNHKMWMKFIHSSTIDTSVKINLPIFYIIRYRKHSYWYFCWVLQFFQQHFMGNEDYAQVPS